MVPPVVRVSHGVSNTVVLSATNISHVEHLNYSGQPIVIQGYSWLFSITRPLIDPSAIAVQIQCHEAYDEFECSAGVRGLVFKWRTEVLPQPGAPLINDESTIAWSPENGCDYRKVGLFMHIIKVEDLPMLVEDSISAVCTIEVQRPAPAPLVNPCAMDTPTDYTLTFSDNTELRVHTQLLQLASTVFSGMLNEFHNSASAKLPENGDDMRTLLTYVYPIKPKPLITLRRACTVARLADKYDLGATVEPHLAALFTHTYLLSGSGVLWLRDHLDGAG
jgi:hypothetical protein